MKKSAQKSKAIQLVTKPKLGDLGFTTSYFTRSIPSADPHLMNTIKLPSSKSDKFTSAVRNFENNINPTLKELLKNQRFSFNIGNQNNFRLGRIGRAEDGSPILGIEYIRKM